MRLALFHPDWAARSCDDCKKYIYNDDGTVTTKTGPDGRTKLPVLRPEGTVTPCWQCPKIPEGVLPKSENAIELNAKNRTAFRHYKECRAVGRFPDDPIVLRNAAVIREIYDQCEASRWDSLSVALLRISALSIEDR